MIPTNVRKRWAALKAEWETAYGRSQRSPNPTDRMITTEQSTWDALVDFVDENDLTYTELDPRGSE